MYIKYIRTNYHQLPTCLPLNTNTRVNEVYILHNDFNNNFNQGEQNRDEVYKKAKPYSLKAREHSLAKLINKRSKFSSLV